MKFIILKKKQLFNVSVVIILIILLLLLILPLDTPESENVFNPIDINKNLSSDFTGDGKDDILEVISKNDKKDIKITVNNKAFFLSELILDNILCDDVSWWPLKVYVKEISRNTTPEIMIQGTKNKKPVTYLFTWNEDNFVNIYEASKNIFGILNSSGNRTPQCYNINSFSGIPSLYSFMVLDNEILDITKDCKPIFNLEIIQTFIDLVQKDYELEEIPDIFKESIDTKELAALWNLDKEQNSYSFQDAFFYDENINANGNITSLKWRLTFEKYVKDKDDSSKTELVIYVTFEKIIENSYKISSFYIQ
ncbi:hypothetical protein [Clostridium vincentii]|uniref:Uncharacterized protein n=1 Tax=Clostridium vincentii TaxID=52704 RepID=A0A2T0BEJ6_9CLOT|nr:hypothetical protein [Clostridium vincentii]PRR82304.1 hypothetical protein CLVI_18100 [Clostridium vincentii]